MKKIRIIIYHLIAVIIFCFIVPIAKEFDKDGFASVLTTLSAACGQGSDIVITINIVVSAAMIGMLYHYRYRYNVHNLFKFLLMTWAIVVPNQICTYSGLLAEINALSLNPLKDFVIFPVIVWFVGVSIFMAFILSYEINNYLERTKNIRESEKHKQKVLGLKLPIYCIWIVIFVISLLVLLYSRKSKNDLAFLISIVVVSTLIIIAILYIVYFIIRKITSNINNFGIPFPPKQPKTRKKFDIYDHPFLSIFMHIGLLLLVSCVMAIMTSGSFNFVDWFKNIKENYDGTESDVIELITSMGFIANFIGAVFIIVIVLFGTVLVYYILRNLVLWASNGYWPPEQGENERVPKFFKDTQDIAKQLMDMIAESAKYIIKFAKFIPDFFKNMYPVVFESNADTKYQFCGIVTEVESRYPLDKVSIYRTDKIDNNLIAITTNSGYYEINELPSCVTSLKFVKEGFYDEILYLRDEDVSDVYMKKIVVGGVIRDENNAVLKGVKIEIVYSNGNKEEIGYTDINGVFEFSSLSGQPCKIYCSYNEVMIEKSLKNEKLDDISICLHTGG